MLDATDDASKADAPEFVTVAEASQRLQIALRTAQRYAAKLAQSDTTLSQNGAVRLVRLSSMAQQAEKAKQSRGTSTGDTTAPLAAGDTTRATPAAQGDMTAARDAKPEDATAEAVNTALVAQLQAENAHLRVDLAYMKDALAKEQETSRALVGELTRANERAAVMIAATATGQMRQINAAASAEPAGENEPGTAKGQLQEASQAASGDDKPVGFWARLWRAGR